MFKKKWKKKTQTFAKWQDSWEVAEFLAPIAAATEATGNRHSRILHDCFFLPIDLLWKTVDQEYVTKLLVNERNYLDQLKYDITRNGLLEPGLLVISPTRCKLQNGNHRIIVCSELGYKYFPITIQHSEGNLKTGALLQEAFGDLIENFTRITRKL